MDLSGVQPPTYLRINLLDVPDKDKATQRIGDDIINCVLSKDVEKTWNEIVKGYRANGLFSPRRRSCKVG